MQFSLSSFALKCNTALVKNTFPLQFRWMNMGFLCSLTCRNFSLLSARPQPEIKAVLVTGETFIHFKQDADLGNYYSPADSNDPNSTKCQTSSVT